MAVYDSVRAEGEKGVFREKMRQRIRALNALGFTDLEGNPLEEPGTEAYQEQRNRSNQIMEQEYLKQRGITLSEDAAQFEDTGEFPDSSNVESATYYFGTGVLEVVYNKKNSPRWQGPRKYRYNLDREHTYHLFESLITAPSPGHDVWVLIRRPKLPFEGPL
jgi:hypothetical protein